MTTHWLDEAERRAETPMLLVERAWIRGRRERLLARIEGRPRTDKRAVAVRYELHELTHRLMQIETELTHRGMA
jgi:hypothetical protein